VKNMQYATSGPIIACGALWIRSRRARLLTATFVSFVYIINLFVIHLIMLSVALYV
jgi:hypothetical protein